MSSVTPYEKKELLRKDETTKKDVGLFYSLLNKFLATPPCKDVSHVDVRCPDPIAITDLAAAIDLFQKLGFVNSSQISHQKFEEEILFIKLDITRKKKDLPFCFDMLQELKRGRPNAQLQDILGKVSLQELVRVMYQRRVCNMKTHDKLSQKIQNIVNQSAGYSCNLQRHSSRISNRLWKFFLYHIVLCESVLLPLVNVPGADNVNRMHQEYFFFIVRHKCGVRNAIGILRKYFGGKMADLPKAMNDKTKRSVVEALQFPVQTESQKKILANTCTVFASICAAKNISRCLKQFRLVFKFKTQTDTPRVAWEIEMELKNLENILKKANELKSLECISLTPQEKFVTALDNVFDVCQNIASLCKECARNLQRIRG